MRKPNPTSRSVFVSATTDSRTATDRKSTRLNSSHLVISYAVFCLKKKINDANIYYVLYCTHAPLPLNADQSSGHIINVSSVCGRHGRSVSAVFHLTQFDLLAFYDC